MGDKNKAIFKGLEELLRSYELGRAGFRDMKFSIRSLINPSDFVD